MIFKYLKKAKQLAKEDTKLKHDLRRLEKMTLDYDALQNIVNYVANAPYGVVIEIDAADGFHMKIQQTMRNGNINYESFYDKYNKQHNS